MRVSKFNTILNKYNNVPIGCDVMDIIDTLIKVKIVSNIFYEQHSLSWRITVIDDTFQHSDFIHKYYSNDNIIYAVENLDISREEFFKLLKETYNYILLKYG